MITVPEAALLVFVLASALAVIFLRDLLAVIIAFAAYSLGMALLWLLLRAPDVGLTEAAIGAGVTTVLFLLTLTKTVRSTDDVTLVQRINWPALGIAVVLAAALLVTVPAMPAIGDAGSPAYTDDGVAQYYLENAYHDTHIENIVTAVLAAYRGFDTFGEVTVVFAAGIAVLVVLKEERFT